MVNQANNPITKQSVDNHLTSCRAGESSFGKVNMSESGSDYCPSG